MNENEFDLAARAWLDEGPTHMSDHAVLSALEEIHATRQRRTLRPAWRATPASVFARVVLAAAIVIAVGLVAGNIIRRQSDLSSVGVPSASPSPADPVELPQLSKTFASPRNGFSIKYPERASRTPAKQLLGFSKQPDDGFDVVETGSAGVFKGASTNVDMIPDGSSLDERIDAYVSGEDVLPGGCHIPRSRQPEITIDGQSARISDCSDRIDATVVAGGRLYLFALSNDRSDARAVFDAFAATIHLTPETAVDYPGFTTTFVSPTNGFSFGYIDRGGLAPAKELWLPDTQPRPDTSGLHDGPFDVVETGLAAVFKGASTPIPDGVSVDAWVDEHLWPRGCGFPRNQLAEITIDGHPGRIAECANHIEATVVAGGRLYLFQLLYSRSDARAFFDAFVATIHLTPETAAVPTSTPSS